MLKLKPPAAVGSVPRPPSVIRFNDTSSLTRVCQLRHFCFLTLVNQTAASGLLFYDSLVQQNVPLLKISDDVIACDLWFATPSTKNPGCAYA